MTVAQLVPTDEDARMAAVRRYDILDTPPDGAFDRIAGAAAALFDVPIGIVSIVDTDRIWFKAHVGLDDVTEIDREPGLCASAILGDEPWVVTDAGTDPRTLANPLVAGEFGLRFYAGVPLTTGDGYNLGTLCVLDTEPRNVTETETGILSHLASLVVDQLELRLSARRALDVAEARLAETQKLAGALQRSLLPPVLPDIPHVRLSAAYHPASRYQVGGDFYDAFPIDGSTWGLVIGDVCGKGPEAAGRTSCARYSMRAAAIQAADPSRVLALVNQALLVDAEPLLDAPFVTALFARLRPHPQGASVTFAAAGHPLPTVLRADGTVQQAGTPGTLLGVLSEVRTSDTTVELETGDAIVLITDGVLDSGRPRLEQGGLEAVLRSSRGLAPEVIAARIQEAVTSEQADDVAILVLTAGS
ncbi:MAG: phosphoserine phosphatase RsbU/P [Actinomycetota bacterium]|jgi:sigma-B regulation protein RsbU (phosphoserine phosphatase)|nr:phosphoserine phosphatase RsbU/P [Actinomycetota bacterium]MDQ1664621.1 phosphoserine phosphatase RsbU/P [Actinomycetota bacterium]